MVKTMNTSTYITTTMRRMRAKLVLEGLPAIHKRYWRELQRQTTRDVAIIPTETNTVHLTGRQRQQQWNRSLMRSYPAEMVTGPGNWRWQLAMRKYLTRDCRLILAFRQGNIIVASNKVYYRFCLLYTTCVSPHRSITIYHNNLNAKLKYYFFLFL